MSLLVNTSISPTFTSDNLYTLYRFTTVGSTNISFNNNVTAQVLIVGGGGAGGNGFSNWEGAGGGGAGAVGVGNINFQAKTEYTINFFCIYFGSIFLI